MFSPPRASACVDLAAGPEAVAVGARAEGRIERELARLQLRDAEPAHRAGVLLGEDHALGAPPTAVAHHLRHPFGGLERRLDAVGEALAVLGVHGEAVHHDRDVVVLAAVQLGDGIKVEDDAVHPRAHEPLAARLLEEVAELPLPAAHQWREDLELRARRPRQHRVGDLAGGLALDRGAVVRAVRRAGARVEEAQVVVDLGDGADGGARVLAGGLLLDRDGGGEPLDRVHVRLLHQPEELPGVGGEGLDVAALALGVDGVEGEGRLAGSGEAGDDGQGPAGDLDVDVAEVVFPRSAYDQAVVRHSLVAVAAAESAQRGSEAGIRARRQDAKGRPGGRPLGVPAPAVVSDSPRASGSPPAPGRSATRPRRRRRSPARAPP